MFVTGFKTCLIVPCWNLCKLCTFLTFDFQHIPTMLKGLLTPIVLLLTWSYLLTLSPHLGFCECIPAPIAILVEPYELICVSNCRYRNTAVNNGNCVFLPSRLHMARAHTLIGPILTRKWIIFTLR